MVTSRESMHEPQDGAAVEAQREKVLLKQCPEEPVPSQAGRVPKPLDRPVLPGEMEASVF